MARRRGDKKKKSSIFKRILQVFGILILLLIAALIAIPYFFKDELKDMALEQANKSLKADVAVGDFDLTIFSTFPKLNLEFDSVSITGRDRFKGVKLIDTKELDIRLDFWSVINMEDITVRSIRLVNPNIHVIVLPDGTANYDIVKSSDDEEDTTTTEESSPFEFELSNYEIVNGNIIYDDQSSPMFAKITGLNHEGSLDIIDSGEEIDLSTNTTIDGLTYEMDGMTYASQIKTKLDMDLKMLFADDHSTFKLQENKLSLNDLHLSFDGFVALYDDYYDMDIKLNAGKITFKNLLSLIPAFYTEDYADMVSKGSMSLSAFAKGKYSDNSYPAFAVNLNVDNASIHYPAVPSPINNININANANYPGGASLDKVKVEVKKLQAQFVGNSIDAYFYMDHPLSDPFIKTKLNANVDLATIKKVYPLGDSVNLNGRLTSDIAYQGHYSTIEKEEYDKINAKGTLQLQNMHYTGGALPVPVEIKNLLFKLSPQHLQLADLTATAGESDFKMSGEVQNYIAYYFNKGDLKGNFNYHSNLLNVDEIYPPTEETPETEQETTTADTASSEPITVPKHINFNLKTSIDKLVYDGMDITNVKGNVLLKNQTATLTNLSMNTMGGSVAVNGSYNTQNPQKPKLDFGYDLKHISISKLASNFASIDKLAPIAKYVDGYVSSNFTMNTLLKPSLEPIYNTLNGNGSLFSNKVKVSGFKPLTKLGNALKMDKLKEQTINNIKAYFTFEDGKVKVKPFNIKLGGMQTNVSGYTSFNQDINYKLQLNIPKDKIPSKIMDVAEKAVSKIKNIPGFKMTKLPDEIPVTAFITNTITQPKIKTNLKEKLMEMGGNVKGKVKDLINEKKEELKDTIQKTIQNKKEDINKELEKKKQEILAKAQKQADAVKAKGKKLADQTRQTANEKAQDLIDKAGNNPFKKAGAKVAAKKIRKEGEEAAQKIEREAQDKANAIMDAARKKAKNLKL